MLFHSFRSQAERREFGGSDFIEFQYCRLPEGASIREIVSVDAIKGWKPDSLYICGGDMYLFYQDYRGIITDGIYNNGDRGPMDLWGSTSIPGSKPMKSMQRLTEEKPPGASNPVQMVTGG